MPVRLTDGSESRPLLPRVIDQLVELIPRVSRETIDGAAHVPHLTTPECYVLVTARAVQHASVSTGRFSARTVAGRLTCAGAGSACFARRAEAIWASGRVRRRRGHRRRTTRRRRVREGRHVESRRSSGIVQGWPESCPVIVGAKGGGVLPLVSTLSGVVLAGKRPLAFHAA
jgi:hypothetical protein